MRRPNLQTALVAAAHLCRLVLVSLCFGHAMAQSAPSYASVYSFGAFAGGFMPHSALVQVANGNLYGTTYSGGDATCNPPNGCGAVFELSPAGVAATLHQFEAVEGVQPETGLVLASDGNFYGTTSSAGGSPATGDGSVFKMTPQGAISVIHLFCPQANCNSDAQPSPLLAGSDGNLYGTTQYGGLTQNICQSDGCGTVYALNIGGAVTPLYDFCRQPGCSDGFSPEGGLAQDAAGNLYGVTSSGGNVACNPPAGCGTVFKLSPTGALTVLYTFTGGTDGASPVGAPVITADGQIYGVAEFGGALGCGPGRGCGTIFKIDSHGTFSALHAFSGPDGVQPLAGLIQASDGNFYGTTSAGGNCSAQLGCGTVFMMNPTGSFTLLHAFMGAGGSDGDEPEAALVQASSGIIYGTTAYGGSSPGCTNNGWCGTVFSITPAAAALTATSTNLAISGSPSAAQDDVRQSVTLTATIVYSGANAPTGTVKFTSGTTVLGTAPLDAGATATFAVSTLSTGQYSVVAAYGGDGSHAGSASAAAPLNVVDFTISAPATVNVTAPGDEGTTTITLTSIAGFNQTVSYQCAGLPALASCSFTPTSTGATLTITTTAPLTTALSKPPGREPQRLYAALSSHGGHEPRGIEAGGAPGLAPVSGLARLAGMIAVGRRPRRTKWLAALALILGIAALGAGCGGGHSASGLPVQTQTPGTPQGSFSVTITATSGPLSHQTAIMLQVG